MGKTWINKDSFLWGALFFSFFVLLSVPVTRATRMRLLLRCILLLSVSTFTAGLDFQQGPSTPGQSLFSRHSYVAEKAAKIAKRSLPAWLSAPANHRIQRRSTEQGGSCRALDGSDTKLEGNTHQVSYRQRSGYSSPA